MLIRILLALLVVGAGLAYTLWHIWCVLPLSTLWRTLLVVLFGALVMSIALVMSPALDALPRRVATVVYEVGGAGPMLLLYTLLLFALLDLCCLLHLLPRGVLHSNALTCVAIVVVLTALLVYGNVNYYHKRRHTITLTTEKPLAEELRMVLISDLHIGYHNDRHTLETWVELLNSEQPDLILLAGDLVDRSMRPLREEDMAAVLRQLHAPVYACMGNHEYYCGADSTLAFYHQAGITVLRDSAVVVKGVNIIGRDDRTNPRRQPLAALMQGVDPRRYTIVLDHQPWHLEEAATAGVDFQFSGHTHHGQIVPMSLIMEAVYENAYGPSARGATQYYVSSGLGIWGGKFRIGTCSEYVVATLTPPPPCSLARQQG